MSRRARAYLPAREAKHAAVWSSPVVHDFDDEADDAQPCQPCRGDGMGPEDDDPWLSGDDMMGAGG